MENSLQSEASSTCSTCGYFLLTCTISVEVKHVGSPYTLIRIRRSRQSLNCLRQIWALKVGSLLFICIYQSQGHSPRDAAARIHKALPTANNISIFIEWPTSPLP